MAKGREVFHFLHAAAVVEGSEDERVQVGAFDQHPRVDGEQAVDGHRVLPAAQNFVNV